MYTYTLKMFYHFKTSRNEPGAISILKNVKSYFSSPTFYSGLFLKKHLGRDANIFGTTPLYTWMNECEKEWIEVKQ